MSFIDLLRKCYFLFTRISLSPSQLEHLISLNITIELYDVDKVNCEDGIIHFVPMRCIRENHSDFTEVP